MDNGDAIDVTCLGAQDVDVASTRVEPVPSDVRYSDMLFRSTSAESKSLDAACDACSQSTPPRMALTCAGSCGVCACGYAVQPYNHYLQASISGCDECWLAVKACVAIVKKHNIFSLSEFEDYVWLRGRHGLVGCVYAPPEGTRQMLEIQLYTEDPYYSLGHCQNTTSTGTHIHPGPMPEICLSFAKRAIEDCLLEHPSCSQAANFVPKRLIDLQVSCSSSNTIRLVVDAPFIVPRGTRYSALSYCWGDAAEIKSRLLSMTKASLARLTQGFEISSLPAAFQDAVITSRFLGVRFLWIDALCIPQADKLVSLPAGEKFEGGYLLYQDFFAWSDAQVEILTVLQDIAKESLEMKDIYSNAFFTIKADSAESANCSFLEMPRRNLREPVTIEVERDHLTSPIFARLVDGHKETFATDARGWILQEALLSKRLLSFTDDEVIFTCLENAVNEGGDHTKGVIRRFLNKTVGLYAAWTRFQRTSQQQDWSVHRRCAVAASLWRDVVTDYSCRELSVASDKLRAIASLAAAHKSLHLGHDRYLAGLWRNSVVSDLLWTTSTFQTSLPAYPSWSWASIQGEIWYDTTCLVPTSAKEDTKLVCGNNMPEVGPTEFDPDLSVKEIVLEGLAFTINIAYTNEYATLTVTPAPETWWPFSRGASFEIHLDQRVDLQESFSDESLTASMSDRSVSEHDPSDVGVKADALLLCHGPIEDEHSTDLSPMGFCLVLAQSAAQEGKYVRIGTLKETLALPEGCAWHEKSKRQRILETIDATISRKLETRQFTVI